MLAPFTSDRTWSFAVSPPQLWSAIGRTEDYKRWWPWLRQFEGDGLRQGARWECRVQPPLPYSLSFSVLFWRVEEGRLAEVTVAGDVAGEAKLLVTSAGEGGSEARLVSSLVPQTGLLRKVAELARPVACWGHDWVLDQGARQFLGRALSLATSSRRRAPG